MLLKQKERVEERKTNRPPDVRMVFDVPRYSVEVVSACAERARGNRLDRYVNGEEIVEVVFPEKLTTEDRERAAQAYNMFFNYYVENDVFQDDGLLKMLRSVDEEYRRVWADFVLFDKSETNPQTWADAWKKVGEIGLTLREIRRQVQQLLGMDEHLKIQSLKKTAS